MPQSPTPPTADQARTAQDKWSNLGREAWHDESLKRRLIENPAAVLEEHGLRLRPGIEIRVVENSDTVAYLTLPRRRATSDLNDEQLDRVAGGGSELPRESVEFNYGAIEWTYWKQ